MLAGTSAAACLDQETDAEGTCSRAEISCGMAGKSWCSRWTVVGLRLWSTALLRQLQQHMTDTEEVQAPTAGVLAGWAAIGLLGVTVLRLLWSVATLICEWWNMSRSPQQRGV